MRKRLLALATALAFACSLAPAAAFASTVAVAIEIGADGAPVEPSGEGWTYSTEGLVLEAGYTFTFTGHALHVSSENPLRNNGVIEDGAFVDASQTYGFAVRNEASGVIRGGAFRGTVSNWGLIEDGAFHASVYNMSNNAGAGTIAGGTFRDYVTNYEGAVISGGAYGDGGNNNSVQNDGTISGGEFNINVNNAGVMGGQQHVQRLRGEPFRWNHRGRHVRRRGVQHGLDRRRLVQKNRHRNRRRHHRRRNVRLIEPGEKQRRRHHHRRHVRWYGDQRRC